MRPGDVCGSGVMFILDLSIPAPATYIRSGLSGAVPHKVLLPPISAVGSLARYHTKCSCHLYPQWALWRGTTQSAPATYIRSGLSGAVPHKVLLPPISVVGSLARYHTKCSCHLYPQWALWRGTTQSAPATYIRSGLSGAVPHEVLLPPISVVGSLARYHTKCSGHLYPQWAIWRGTTQSAPAT